MKDIIEAYGIEGNVEPLNGGQNTSIKVGDYAIKPAGDPIFGEWVLSIFDQLDPVDYRISRPIKAKNGKFIYNGFLACHFEPGKEIPCNIEDKVQVTQNLHRDLKDVDYSDRPFPKDPWSRAHRIVWGDQELPELHSDVLEVLKPLLKRLSNRERDDFQVIHSDLYGNILFHDELNPLVIDFSPTIGPPEYGLAIMICDGIAWEKCDLNFLSIIKEKELILRAALFRMITVAMFPGLTVERFFAEVNAYDDILKWYDEEIQKSV